MRYLLSLLLLVLAFIANARQITPDEALAAAQDFFNNSSVEQPRTPCAIFAHPNTAQSVENAPYYIFNNSDNNGFVIISGDDRAKKILGYSDKGSFDLTNVPPQLSDMLDHYAESISRLSGTSVDQSWTTAPRAATTDGGVLLETANWGQGTPYNELCPKYDDLPVSVGCVGTAMAIILKYHQWPIRSHGTISYTWSKNDTSTETITYEYGQKPYQWDIMLDEYWDYTDASDESRLAVAEVCRDCAFASNASFTNWSTGGSTNEVYLNLIRHFDYDTSIQFANFSSYNFDEYCNILKSELREGRPVLYLSERTPAGYGAHAYVCDGFDNNNYFHFNFGWNGGCNGYYSIEEHGLLGPNQDFYYGIKKYDHDEDVLSLTGGGADFKWIEGNEVAWVGSHLNGWRTHMMSAGYAIENTATHQIQYYTVQTFDWQLVYGFDKININNTPTQDGEYIVYPVARFVDGEWKKYPFSDQWQSYICLTVNNGQREFSNPEIDFPVGNGKIEIDNIFYILDDESHTATVTFKNYRYNSYSNSVSIPETITYNNQTYLVTTIDEDALRECNTVTAIEIPNSVEIVGKRAFTCYANEPITITIGKDSKLKEIKEGGFYATMVENFDFPNGLEIIGTEAFKYHRMSKIVIPKSVKRLEYQAFTTCGMTQKEDIYVEWTTEDELSEINWYAFDETNTTPQWKPFRKLYVPRGYKGLYEANVNPEMIDEIEEYDMAGISEITSAEPNNLISIFNIQGIKVFQGNPSDIPTLPNGIYLKQIGDKVVKVVI